MKLLGYIIPMVFSWVFGLVEAGMFYLLADRLWGHDVSWALWWGVWWAAAHASYIVLRHEWQTEFE